MQLSYDEYNEYYFLLQIFDNNNEFNIDETKEKEEDIFEKKYNGPRSIYMW